MPRDDDDTERAHRPRERAPGRLTLAEQRLAALQAADADGDGEADVVEVAHVEARRVVVEAISEFANGPNLKLVVLGVVLIALAPIVIVGTWAIDGGIAVHGWGCYGTATFCRGAVAAPDASGR